MNKQTVFSKRRFFTIQVVGLVLLAASVTWALAQSEVVTYSACVNNAIATRSQAGPSKNPDSQLAPEG